LAVIIGAIARDADRLGLGGGFSLPKLNVSPSPQTEVANFDICVKVHKNALFHTKYLKNFLGMGHRPFPRSQ